jgi:hypothetical protein
MSQVGKVRELVRVYVSVSAVGAVEVPVRICLRSSGDRVTEVGGP